MENKPAWMNDPAISNIDVQKLELLNSIVSQSEQLNQKEKMNLFMNFMKTSKEKNIRFSSEELRLLIDTIKRYSTPEELLRLNSIMNQNKK